MEKKVLTLLIVVITGIVIGVAVAVQRTVKPVIVMQLNEIIHSLKTVEKGLSNLDRRLAAIETQSQQVANTFKNFQAPSLRVAQQPQQPQQPQAPAVPSEDYNKAYTIDIAHSPVRGNPKAPVTIVEFVDFQCPFCQRFYPPVQETLKAYPKEVNYILKSYPLPFHPQARPAAKAAFAAGEQGKYWEMVDLLMQNAANLSDEKFKELAQQLKLNVDKFMKDYKEKDARWEELINKDINLGGQVDVRGTPTFYINGRKTVARDINAFKAEIDKLLNEKKNQ